jgi:hypothetical protein
MLLYVTLSYIMLCYVTLRYFMCYVMLRYVTLFYVMLLYIMLCYVTLRYVMLCYALGITSFSFIALPSYLPFTLPCLFSLIINLLLCTFIMYSSLTSLSRSRFTCDFDIKARKKETSRKMWTLMRG